jgi:enolase
VDIKFLLQEFINGGAHADWATDVQEYMIMPIGAENFARALEMGTEIYHALKKIIEQSSQLALVGDEGGFVPESKDNEAPFKLIMKAIEKAGFKPGTDIALAIDAAASEWYKNGQYHLKKDGAKDAEKLMVWYEDLTKKYPLISIEDPFGEDDWQSFTKLTGKIGSTIQIIGDDLYVTNKMRLERGIQSQATNAILIKPNQIGTLTETIETIKLAQANNLKTIISHRSGETNDDFIADLAVASGAGQIKAGAPAREERVAKYNRLAEIETELDKRVKYYTFT